MPKYFIYVAVPLSYCWILLNAASSRILGFKTSTALLFRFDENFYTADDENFAVAEFEKVDKWLLVVRVLLSSCIDRDI